MPTWISHWLRDARLLIFSQFLVVLTTTALAIVLARSLGPSDWGLFSALLGLSLALSMFVDVGLGTWLLRGLSRLHEEEPEPDRRYREASRRLVAAILTNVVFGTLLFVGAAIVATSTGTKLSTTITLLGLIAYTVLLAVTSCLESFLRAERRLKRIVVGTLLERFLLLGLVGAALLHDLAIWAIALAYVASGIARLSFIGFTVFVDQHVPVVRPQFRAVRRFIREGIPFAFNTVALVAIPKLDTFVIAGVSATAAGYYALGDRVIGPAIFIPVVASTALYPYLAREGPGSTAAWRISGGMWLLGAGAAVAGAVLAPVIVPAVFGPRYVDAVPVVQLMLFVLPFVYASNTLLVHAYSSGRERQLLAVTLTVSIVGTGAIVGGVLWHGALGAAAGFVLRQILFTLALGGIALLPRRSTHRAVYEPEQPISP